MTIKHNNQNMKIVELDGYAANPGDLSWEPFRQLGELVVYERSTPAQVMERAKDAEAILINKIEITDAVMGRLPQLRYIGILATGYNLVDVVAAKRRGIVVTNVPAYSTESVAQMVFAHLLNVSNRIGHYTRQAREGRWSQNPDFCYWDTPLMELAGKTMGIVGLGNIGLRVATIARAFGMDVFAYTSKSADKLPQGIQKTTLEGLLGASDVLTLHCPLTAETKEMINANTLRLMKPGAILINTGRGQLVNETDVADALDSGSLRAFCTDVLCQEPPLAENPLFRCPNAYITPHIAWATLEARQRLMNVAVENLMAFIAGNPINVVS